MSFCLMWQEQKESSCSPFECAVCGACVYESNSGIRMCLPCKSFCRRHALLPPNTLKCYENGECYIEATRRYFSASLPPCRACRLQKCLSVEMDQSSFRSRSISSPPLLLTNSSVNNVLLQTSSLNDRLKVSESKFDNQTSNTGMMYNRVRSSSEVSGRQRQFEAF